jgi:hypothetical protein
MANSSVVVPDGDGMRRARETRGIPFASESTGRRFAPAMP